MPPDITVACTYILSLISVGNGQINLKNISKSNFQRAIIEVFGEMGIEITDVGLSHLQVEIGNNKIVMPKPIICDVMPGFPTDVGPILSASVAGLSGVTSIVDRVYDKRSSHVVGLNKLGFYLESEDNKVFVFGQTATELDVVVVEAVDIRAGAALLVGALGSNTKEVLIKNYNQVHRGYASLVDDLESLGANIQRD